MGKAPVPEGPTHLVLFGPPYPPTRGIYMNLFITTELCFLDIRSFHIPLFDT